MKPLAGSSSRKQQHDHQPDWQAEDAHGSVLKRRWRRSPWQATAVGSQTGTQLDLQPLAAVNMDRRQPVMICFLRGVATLAMPWVPA
jgi:hypothetical protein